MFDDEEVLLFVSPVIAVPVLVWLVLVIIAGVKKYVNWWRWGLLVPGFIIATIVVSGFTVPGRIGWQLARGDMDRAAAECGSLESGRFGVPYQSRTVGSYEFHHIGGGPGGECTFFLSRYYPGITSGFVYLPDGRIPTDDIDHQYVHLGGYWHYFKR